jgi:hypothetical protein
MLIYILVVCFLNLVYSQNKQCSSCKYFIPHINKNPDLGLCGFFKNKLYDNTNLIIYEYAVHCRNNQRLCGNDAYFYEEIDNTNNKTNDIDNTKMIELYDNLNNICCGEVNEKNEIDEFDKLERDFFDIYKRIQKHNTKKIYKTAKDIYKLFKKK